MKVSIKFVVLAVLIGLGGAVLPSVAEAKPGSWLSITSGSRFEVLTSFNNEAVLDRETGLVWQKVMITTPITNQALAKRVCLATSIGNHYGFRLPTYEELATLADPTTNGLQATFNTSTPATNFPALWTSSTGVDNGSVPVAFRFILGTGIFNSYALNYENTDDGFVLCVRGSSN